VSAADRAGTYTLGGKYHWNGATVTFS